MTIAQLVTALSASGVSFVRDVWVKQPSGNYGTVSIVSQRVMWADNKPVREQVTYAVMLFTPGNGDAEAKKVEQAIMGLKSLRTFARVATEYLDGEDLMSRRWDVVLEGKYA